MTRAVVDVIVPAFRQHDLVRQCIESLLVAECTTPHRIIVVDDCSSDADLSRYLAEKVENDEIELHVNPKNLGFTRTVNFAMQQHLDRDVVLLNSDTIVYPQWLDRIRFAALSADDIATVNPMTTQYGSHISCYPGLTTKFDGALEVTDNVIDAIARAVNAGKTRQVHATVGFCMHINRKALDEIGYFDATNFPVAYGEESDFCYRATKTGWRHLVAGDVFVTHLEGKSYGEKKAALMANMLARFAVLHPEAAMCDRRFERNDPLRLLRAAIDLGRVARWLEGTSTLVVVGDGDRAPAGRLPWLQFDGARSTIAIRSSEIAAGSLPNIDHFVLPAELSRFNAALDGLGIKHLSFQSERTCQDFDKATKKTHRDEVGLAVAMVA